MSFYCPKKVNLLATAILMVNGLANASEPPQRKAALEEVIVTAQKREEDLQKTPIAISVLDRLQMDSLGITGLDSLSSGIVPSLRIMPYANSRSTLILAVRGNGPTDVSEVTRESAVAIYVDGIYQGRAQGLNAEVPDLERIEVLRGPQGTLFGRNATGGAINMITKKPSGVFSLEQSAGVSNYDGWRSSTRINFPELYGISAKFDYIHAQRNGWVHNAALGEWNYDAWQKDGARFSFRYNPLESVTIDFAHDQIRSVTTQNYFQMYIDGPGLIGEERNRLNEARYPVTLRPTITKQWTDSIIISWDASDEWTFKSLSARKRTKEDTNDNYDGVLYFGGLNANVYLSEDQFTQEFQALLNTSTIQGAAGVFLYRASGPENTQNYFNLDLFSPGVPRILPPTTINPYTGMPDPLRAVHVTSESKAAYAQATWTPRVLDNKLHLTGGLRYTRDDKEGRKTEIVTDRFDLNTNHTDYTVILSYNLLENINTYIKRSTGYHAGGANPRSLTFRPYGEETVKSSEIGLKSEWFERRVRANFAIFDNIYSDLQLDYSNPANVTYTETVNASKKVRVRGGEIELTVNPAQGLTVGLNYSYLGYSMPLQPNPISGQLEKFVLTQTPRHAGSATFDYSLSPFEFGILSFHIDATSTDQYAYASKSFRRMDGYTLFNAKVSLSEIPFGRDGSLEVALWGANLTDEEYIVMAFPGGPTTEIQAFGDPRTYGFDLTYKFK